MITPELVSYIKKQIQNNISKDLIISKLSSVGWHSSDIDEGFLSIDKYREPLIEGDFIDKEKDLQSKEKIEEVKTEEVKKEEFVLEEKPRIWTPMSVPIKRNIHESNTSHKETDISNIDSKKTTAVEVQHIELPRRENNLNLKKESNIDVSVKRKNIESFVQHNVIVNPKYFNKNENSTSSLISNSFHQVKSDDTINKNENLIPGDKDKDKDHLSDVNLPKIAMLSSYKKDIMSIEKQKEEGNLISKKSKSIKFFIFLTIIIAIGIFSWAFSSGYINIENLNIFSIKKDPKVLLLNNSKALSSLSSYKTETNLEITSPSFARISSALMTGETISSDDKDFISINTLGVINQNNKIPVFDNFITIKSSLLQNYITVDVKNNESSLFVSIPDLSPFIDENAPASSVVKINELQFEMIPSLFPKNIETNLKKLNLYNIISKGMSSYINTDTLSSYNELISNVEIIEKGTENIKGIDTYHYSVNANKQLLKKLLSKISENFVLNLSDDDRSGLDQILGTVDINSFDIWIGKGDNNIYQYSVILGVPLSKLIGFEDKSIGDNQVKISWKTTYYDFNVVNNLFVPEISVPATDYINSIKEAEMKNDVSSFSQLATNLLGIEKSYGNKSNAKGDCMAPVSGSLFSPTGHIKNSTTIISSISSLLNKILAKTNGIGFCPSSSKDWSFTVPISSNYDPAFLPEAGYQSFYCVDSTGAKENLTALPTGNSCLPKVNLTKVNNQ